MHGFLSQLAGLYFVSRVRVMQHAHSHMRKLTGIVQVNVAGDGGMYRLVKFYSLVCVLPFLAQQHLCHSKHPLTKINLPRPKMPLITLIEN